MSYRDAARRLAELESTENARVLRVQNRVLDHLTDAQVAIFAGYVARWEDDPDAEPTPAEWDILERVDALVRADPEARPSEYVGLNRQVTR